ncbi:MAG: YraN family protein [Bacteroidales bacterium]|jgi:putative endonuclease
MGGHNEIGKKGELLAAGYIKKKGYRIVRTNWRYRHKEIDIIAYDGPELVIVEVKLRSTDYFGDPSEAVTKKKQRFLIEAAEAYLGTIVEAPEVRFDVISIVAGGSRYEIDHITDAFNP